MQRRIAYGSVPTPPRRCCQSRGTRVAGNCPEVPGADGASPSTNTAKRSADLHNLAIMDLTIWMVISVGT